MDGKREHEERKTCSEMQLKYGGGILRNFTWESAIKTRVDDHYPTVAGRIAGVIERLGGWDFLTEIFLCNKWKPGLRLCVGFRVMLDPVQVAAFLVYMCSPGNTDILFFIAIIPEDRLKYGLASLLAL